MMFDDFSIIFFKMIPACGPQTKFLCNLCCADVSTDASLEASVDNECFQHYLTVSKNLTYRSPTIHTVWFIWYESWAPTRKNLLKWGPGVETAWKFQKQFDPCFFGTLSLIWGIVPGKHNSHRVVSRIVSYRVPHRFCVQRSDIGAQRGARKTKM